MLLILSFRRGATFATLLHALPCLAVSCEDLRAEVESRIRSTGTSQFIVAIVDTAASVPGKIVGTCNRGSKKLVYTQAPPAPTGTNEQTAASSATGRPARKVEPIITECKDGSVVMNSDCKK